MISDTSTRQRCHIFTSEDVITDKPISGPVRGHLGRHRSVCARQNRAPRRRHRKISQIICAKSHVCLPETALGLRRIRRRRVVVTLFRRSNDIEVSISSAFDKEYGPGEAPGHSGIYRCRGCGCEIVSEALEPLPLEKHPKHSLAQGVVRWRLAVAAQPEPH